MEKKLGENIKNARKRAGFTQKSFADALGITQSTVAKYESGLLSVSTQVLEQISLSTGTPVNTLLGVKATDDDASLTSLYNSLNEVGKRRLREYLDELLVLYPQ